MKRMISMLLALVMVFGLAACGAKEEAPSEAVSFKVIGQEEVLGSISLAITEKP